MEDIEERIYLREDLSRLDALGLEQGTDVLYLLGLAYALLMPLSMCFPFTLLVPVWAALCMTGLKHIKPFLRAQRRMDLYRILFWTFLAWLGVGLLTFAPMVFYVLAETLAFRSGVSRSLSFLQLVSFGSFFGNMVYIFLVVLLLKYFEILFRVFHKKSKMARAHAFLITFCIAELIAINGAGLIFLNRVLGEKWVSGNPLMQLLAGFPLQGLIAAISVILYLVVAPLTAILFFREVRQVLPRIRGLSRREQAFEDGS